MSYDSSDAQYRANVFTYTPSWYLGEVDQEAATSILIASDVANVFVVYRLQDSNKYMLSARWVPMRLSRKRIVYHTYKLNQFLYLKKQISI